MLHLYMHPLSSFCWKALIALYESGIAFEAKKVDLSNPVERDELLAVWPIGKFPVLVDDETGRSIPESTSIIEHLASKHPAASGLVPRDSDAALEVRSKDRFFDLYLHLPMQAVVGDRLRAPDAKDPTGVEKARTTIRTAYAIAERQMVRGPWAAGEAFTLADCAAMPALHYANRVEPMGTGHPSLAAYLERLEARPSVKRVLAEAAPYAAFFPA